MSHPLKEDRSAEHLTDTYTHTSTPYIYSANLWGGQVRTKPNNTTGHGDQTRHFCIITLTAIIKIIIVIIEGICTSLSATFKVLYNLLTTQKYGGTVS